MKQLSLLSLLSLLVIASSTQDGSKINYPRILLPIFQKISIQFTLEINEGGCFKWITSRNDLIQITPIYDDTNIECSYKAKITVITKDQRRNTAIVLAEDLQNDEVLRCDVILDVIEHLNILTITRELFLEEAPETFEIFASDSQGNVFTTLEGVEFDWKIISQNDKYKQQNVLRFLTFSESKYHEIPKTLEKFEQLGLKGYKILLEGINTGTAKVSVTLPYQEYSHVPPIEVDIAVLANIILDPSDAYIMIGDTVEFRILQLKGGKLQEISSSNQYYLEIQNNEIATISGNKVTGKKLGRTLVIFRDHNVPITEKNLKNDDDIVKSETPIATLTVVTPGKIGINLLPYNNWITIEGQKHEIAIDLYTIDDKKILLGSRYNIESQLDESYFYVLKKCQNGSRLYGEALKEGVTTVTGTYNDLTASEDLKIYKELIIKPKKVILPFDPNQTVRQHKIKFTAIGGDGYYQWQSLNPDLIHINQNGNAEIREFLDPGVGLPKPTGIVAHANIKVQLKRNPKIYRTAEIFFLPPVKLEIISYNFETALDDYVYIHIGLFASINGTLIPFTSCNTLHFNYEFTLNSIFQQDNNDDTIKINKTNQLEDEQLVPNACHLLKFRAINLGMTNFQISYTYMNTILKDQIILNVFEKLSILDPKLNEIILPIGSTRNIIYKNGPQKFFNIDADLIKSIKIDQQIAKITENPAQQQHQQQQQQSSIKTMTSLNEPIHVFNVLCKKIGETMMTFEIYNKLLTEKDHILPYISKHEIKIYCVKPRFINLYAMEKLRSGCPLEFKNSLMHIKSIPTDLQRNKKHNSNNFNDIQIEIEILDAKNRKLMNITSLIIEWEFLQMNNEKITQQLQKNFQCKRYTEIETIEQIEIPYRDYLLCSIINNIEMNFKIKGTVVEYDYDILYKYGITPEVPNFYIKKLPDGEIYKPLIENEINLVSVDSTVFPYEEISIFLSKTHKEIIPIKDGSGYYEIELSEDGIIKVEFDKKSKQLIVTPLNIGNVEIILTDGCLLTESSRLQVHVVRIGKIHIDVGDRVQKLKTIELILNIYDSNDKLLKIDHNNLHEYEISYNILDSSILSLQQNNQNRLNDYEIRYLVTGMEIGETKIIFHSNYHNYNVSSVYKNIQVFPPLRLYPRNSTLIIGSSLQITYEGGPYPDANVIYSIQNSNILSIDSTLVTAKKLGITRIIGKSVGIDPTNDKPTVFSEDSIEIHVVPLEKIRIQIPLLKIKCNSIMPASIWGIPNLSPFILGTLKSLRVIWSTNQPNVIDIFEIFSQIGVEYNEQDLVSVRIRAINPGKAKIQATVILPATGEKLIANVEIVVFKTLQLESPKHIIEDQILMAPQSTIHLKSNMDGAEYKIDNEKSKGIIHITQNGIVKSSEILGRDTILAQTSDQSLPIGIEVKNIHYIMANIQYPPSIQFKNIEERLPKGIKLKLKISIHDNLGNEFSHSISNIDAIEYQMSHNDVVDMQIGDNLTISMHTYPGGGGSGNGDINNASENNAISMIVVRLKDNSGTIKYSEDYIKIATYESKNMFPTKSKSIIFATGDIICFESPLPSSSEWFSSNEQVLTIDKITGLAKILNTKNRLNQNVNVIHGDKVNSFIKFNLDIRETDQISFTKTEDIFNGYSYKAYLQLRNHMQTNKITGNVFARNISKCLEHLDNSNDIIATTLFTCNIKAKTQQNQEFIKHYYTIMSIFDRIKASYACKIELKSDKQFHEILNITKQHEIIEIEAQLSNGNSDYLNLQIIPAINVHPSSHINIEQITEHGIKITGENDILKKLEIHPSHPDIMQIIIKSKAHGNLMFKVKLLKDICLTDTEELKIIINSPATGQKIILPIEIESNKCCSGILCFKNYISNFGLLVSLIVLIISLFWLFISITSRNREQQSFNRAFQQQRTRFSTNSSLLQPSPNTLRDISSLNQSIGNLSQSPLSYSSGAGGGTYFNISQGQANLSAMEKEEPVYGQSFKRLNRRYL